MGLEEGASLSEIKKSYRALAMRYHPDRNPSPKAAEGFILVNEAYEYLRKSNHRIPAKKRPMTTRERDEFKRKSRHDDWEGMEREAARMRAAMHAKQSFSEFEKSKIYKAARVIDQIYNYVFLAVGLVILVGPFLNIAFLNDRERAEYNYYLLVIPFVLGILFLYGIWYFVFNLEDEPVV